MIEKLQCKTPDDRFQSANEVKRYLNDYLAFLQQPTTRKAPHQVSTPAWKRRRRMFWLRAGGVLLLTSAVVVAATMAIQPLRSISSPTGLLGSTAAAVTSLSSSAQPMASLPTMPQIDAEIASIADELYQLESASASQFVGFGISEFDQSLHALQSEVDLSTEALSNSSDFDLHYSRLGSIDTTLQAIEGDVQELEHSPNP